MLCITSGYTCSVIVVVNISLVYWKCNVFHNLHLQRRGPHSVCSTETFAVTEALPRDNLGFNLYTTTDCILIPESKSEGARFKCCQCKPIGEMKHISTIFFYFCHVMLHTNLVTFLYQTMLKILAHFIKNE